MIIRKATLFDLNRLITLRLDYFKCERGLKPEQETQLSVQLRKYFLKAIPSGEFIAYLGEEDGKVVSTAFLLITERPAAPHFITGKTGTILNVLTYPEFRRRGYSTLVLRTLIEDAKKADVAMLDLFSTQGGQPLYKKLGFKETEYTALRLYL
jgi:N-acetylglutamate synthase and related acetyltransferases